MRTAVETYELIPAYARLSRKSRGGRIESIPHQFATLDRLAAYRGDTIGLRFADKHLSAWDQSVTRPDWEAFLAELDTGRHRAAMSYHADRLSRNGMDTERLLQIGERWGIVLITPEGVYDLGNGDQRAMFRHLAAMTINQSDATHRRVSDHKDEARLAGLMRDVYGGPPPVGFRQGKDDWEVDPEQADWLREAARLVLADPDHRVGTAYRQLPAIVTNPADPRDPDSKGRPVSLKMLRAALQRPASAGLITSRDGEVIGESDAGGPLDLVTYNRLQLVFATRKVGRPVTAGRYPFGPVLRCGKCGNQLTGTPGFQKRGYYSCRNPHLIGGVKVGPCRGVSIPAADLHELVRLFIETWADSDAARAAFAEHPQTGARRAELDADLDDLGAQLAALSGRRLRERSQVARLTYDDLIGEAEAAIAAVEAELAELDRLDAEPGLPASLDWETMTDAERLRVLAQAARLPIVVLPGKSGPKPMPVIDRVILEPQG
jgi:DNA invertase Pin-like site-specific DNA recombinase